MKEYFHSKKRVFFTFFIFGILVLLLDVAIQIYWVNFVRVILGESNFGLWDVHTPILRYMRFAAYSPWFILVVILGKDFVRKDFSRTIAFFVGLGMTYFTLICYSISLWGA